MKSALKLLDYDDEHRTDLVHTLSVYLHHHGSHKRSARILHLHANTVAYRAARIEKITGLDLDDPTTAWSPTSPSRSSSRKAQR